MLKIFHPLNFYKRVIYMFLLPYGKKLKIKIARLEVKIKFIPT